EGGHVLRHARLDDRPTRDNDQDGDERVQQHEQHRDAVHPEVVVDAETLDPGLELLELEGARAGVETGEERDRDEETEYGADERQPARDMRVTVGASGQNRRTEQNRYPDR